MEIDSIVDPLTLAEVKEHLAVLDDMDDVLISSYIETSLHYVQNYIGKNVATINVSEVFELWENPMYLEWSSEVRSATIEYLDTLDVLQTLNTAVYAGNIIREDAALDYNGGSITVRYNPYIYKFELPIYRQARLLIIGDWYANRENTVTGTQTSELNNTGVKTILDTVKAGRI